MKVSKTLAYCLLSLTNVLALPATPVKAADEKRAASPVTNSAQFLATYAAALQQGASAVKDIFGQIVPLPGPTAIAQAQQELATIQSANPNDFFKSGAEILLSGLAGGDYATIANAYLLESNTNNFNPISPVPAVYPKASPSDAPYSLSEATLRQAIYIPPGFQYGRSSLPIVLFLPGTGALAGQSFGPNIAKLLVANKVADPVFVNLPGENLADIQVAAEYAAYAVNYISGISQHKNVSTISWSAGSLDGQWALKYWPSTRSKLSDKIGVSPDYHGTILAPLLCPGFETPGCTPAIAQQTYNSTFIKTLRANGGDSAYVPTTNIYSIFDEIVQPQADPNASGALLDARGAGVSNVELQNPCTALLPGGAIYNDHEGVLVNALAYALIVDALQHPGPGQLSRINTATECAKFVADGLSLADVLATYALIPLAAVNIIAFEPKSAGEPPIMPYAASG